MRYRMMLATEVGEIWLCEEDGALARISLPGEAAQRRNPPPNAAKTCPEKPAESPALENAGHLC